MIEPTISAGPDIDWSDVAGRAEPAIVWSGADRLAAFLVPISELKPFPGNSRRGDVERLMESLTRFGQVRPVLVLDDHTIVAGHHIVKAATRLGWTHVAAIPAEFESRDDARAYLIADNQLAALGGIDSADQMSILEEIAESGRWEGTGFSADDLADMQALSVHKTELIEATKLRRHSAHYREHDETQLEHLTASLAEHGFYRNVVCARDGTILAGHGVVEAAQRLGLKRIPITRLDVDPDDPEALKILAGDNELSRLSDLDPAQLADLLSRARDDASLLGTGFTPQTLAALIMVSRPPVRVAAANSEWVALPEYEPPEKAIVTHVYCETEEDRTKMLALLGIALPPRKHGRMWSTWWPERERGDPNVLRFDQPNMTTTDRPKTIPPRSEDQA